MPRTHPDPLEVPVEHARVGGIAALKTCGRGLLQSRRGAAGGLRVFKSHGDGWSASRGRNHPVAQGRSFILLSLGGLQLCPAQLTDRDCKLLWDGGGKRCCPRARAGLPPGQRGCLDAPSRQGWCLCGQSGWWRSAGRASCSDPCGTPHPPRVSRVTGCSQRL